MADAKQAATKVAATAVKATPQGKAAGAAAKATGAAKAAGTAKAAGQAPAQKAAAAPRARGDRGGTGPSYRRIVGKGRKWLLAELVVCLLLLGLAGLTGKTKRGEDDPNKTGSDLAVKGSALAGVFIVLGLVSAGGRGAQKAAGALGLLITLAYVFDQREVFVTIGQWAKERTS